LLVATEEAIRSLKKLSLLFHHLLRSRYLPLLLLVIGPEDLNLKRMMSASVKAKEDTKPTNTW